MYNTIQLHCTIHNDLQPAGYAKHPTLITAITLTLALHPTTTRTPNCNHKGILPSYRTSSHQATCHAYQTSKSYHGYEHDSKDAWTQLQVRRQDALLRLFWCCWESAQSHRWYVYTHTFIYNNVIYTSILISSLTCEKNKQKASHTTSPSKSKRSKSAPTLFRTRLCSRRSKRLGNRSQLGRRTANLRIFNQNPNSHFQLSIFSDSSGTDSPLFASSHRRWGTVMDWFRHM